MSVTEFEPGSVNWMQVLFCIAENPSTTGRLMNKVRQLEVVSSGNMCFPGSQAPDTNLQNRVCEIVYVPHVKIISKMEPLTSQ